MKWFVGADHAGFHLKQDLVQTLVALGDEVEDLGTVKPERCDYPDFAAAVGRKVADDPTSLGLLVCGSGTGMAIAANKIPGVRAACIGEPTSAHLAREHNDVNVLCLGQRVTGPALAEEVLLTFRDAKFEGGRHADRLDKIRALGAGPAAVMRA